CGRSGGIPPQGENLGEACGGLGAVANHRDVRGKLVSQVDAVEYGFDRAHERAQIYRRLDASRQPPSCLARRRSPGCDAPLGRRPLEFSLPVQERRVRVKSGARARACVEQDLQVTQSAKSRGGAAKKSKVEAPATFS